MASYHSRRCSHSQLPAGVLRCCHYSRWRRGTYPSGGHGRSAMATTRDRAVAAVATGADWLTPTEMRTLEAVCEALIPATPPPEGQEDAHGLYARPASALGIARLVAETLAPEALDTRAEFNQLLGVLHSPLARIALTGRPQGLSQMPLPA